MFSISSIPFGRMHRQICGVSGLILTLLSVSPAETEEASLEGNIHALYYAKNADKPAWRDEYPSAKTCQVCHPTHYRQWSVSPHSYAQLSPVFGAMQETINLKTGGTNGDFCIRCHTPVGMNLGEKTSMSNIDRHPTSREGITCIVCHRINAPYGKISGRIFLPQGNLVEIAIGGPTPTNSILAEAINAGLDIGTKSDAGRKVHAATEFFAPLTDAGFCGSCHDVLLQNGFRLEEAFSEYKRSPAIKKGITCQDCHMGKEHGKFVGTFDDPKQLEKLSIEDLKEKARLAAAVGPVMQARLAHLISKNDDSKSLWIDAIIFFQKAKSNYTYGPAAIIDGKPTAIRKITNHMMPGPDHSIIHPGIYPHNKSAVRDERENPETAEGLATIREWLEYDHQAGWGQKEFELAERKRVLSGAAPTPFPERWAFPDSRLSARSLLDKQFELLNEYLSARDEVLRAGFEMGDVVVTEASRRKGIKLKIRVTNATDGHGVPTGFIGERVIFVQIIVTDAGGNLIFKSGDLDPNGDYRDSHSSYVHDGKLPLDKHLFTLQSRFLATLNKGGEREEILPIPISLTTNPFIRPGASATTSTGDPGTARIHKNNILPGDSRWAKYTIPPEALKDTAPPYRADVKFIVGMVPINLVKFVSQVGFDYNMSALDVATGVLRGHTVLHETSKIIDVE